jgi:hypothetical protein
MCINIEAFDAKNHARPATTVRALKGARITSEADRSAEKGEDISTMKRSITPTWSPSVTLIGTVISTASDIMNAVLTAATDPGAVDKITFLGCPTCRPWSN